MTQNDDLMALALAWADPAAIADLAPERMGDPYHSTLARMLRDQWSREAIAKVCPGVGALLAAVDPDAAPGDAMAARLAQRWTLYGPDYLLQSPEPPEYLVHGMIRQGALVCVYGAPGGLKSLFAQDLAVCVAAGIPWLDPLPDGRGEGGAYPVKQAPVLWMDQDNGKKRLQERFGALLRARGLGGDVPLQAVSLPVPAYDASDWDDARILADQIMALGAGLCVIDNLGTVSGGRDENASEMVGVMAHLRWVAEETGATLVVIHHPRKGGAGRGVREGDQLRGHSSIEASLDLALLTEREEDYLTAQSTKTRDDTVTPFTVRWTFERTPHGALDRARFWHVRTEKPKRPQYAQIGEALAGMLDGRGFDSENAFREAIIAEFDVTKTTADRAIAWAASEGTIRAEQGKGKTAPKRYRRADSLPTF